MIDATPVEHGASREVDMHDDTPGDTGSRPAGDAPAHPADPDAGTAELLRRTAELAIEYRAGLADRPVAPRVSAAVIRNALGGPMPARGEPADQVVEALAREVPPGLMAMPGPRFFGFVIGGSLPAALAADWLTSAWDQNAPSAVSSPAAAAVETIAGHWLVELLGLPRGTSVGFTTGATMANFTGLAAARDAVLRRVGWDVEADGLHGGPRVSVVIGEDAHVTVFLGLRMLGFGEQAPLRVAADQEGRMRLDALRTILGRASGPTIVCLQAGNVNSGSFDPLAAAIAVVREVRPEAWIHIDGAFGLWAAAVPSLRHRIAGYEGADSWSTDAHKWLNVPYDCGLVFVSDPEAHRAAMGMNASYLPFNTGDERDPGDFVPELSRRARGFPVYAALRALGRSGVVELVERCCELARRFADGLAAEPGTEILNEVVLNQVLVRFDDSDDRTRDVVARLQADGTAWFGGGAWHGRAVMRISVSNWWTRADDVDRSLDAIRRCLAESRRAT
jgi:glutamate/tyrosine decarboxylase-like PLP-dependent enzyme